MKIPRTRKIVDPLNPGRGRLTVTSCPTSSKQGQQIQRETKSRLEEAEMGMMMKTKTGAGIAQRQVKMRATPRKKPPRIPIVQDPVVAQSTLGKPTENPLLLPAKTTVSIVLPKRFNPW